MWIKLRTWKNNQSMAGWASYSRVTLSIPKGAIPLMTQFASEYEFVFIYYTRFIFIELHLTLRNKFPFGFPSSGL